MCTRRIKFARATTIASTLALVIGGWGGSALAVGDKASDQAEAKGIDVSNHNGDINWKKVATDGQEFTFVLATDGDSFTSDKFTTQYSGAKEAGLLVGAYHFARPDGSAAKQADRFLKTANYANDGKTLPPVLDLEVDPKDGGCYGQSADKLKEWTKTFTGKVKESTGRDAVVYTSQAFWDKCMGGTNSFKENPLWVASWGVDKPQTPGGWEKWTFWQYSDKGSVDGVNGKVDVDKFNGTAEQLKQFAGQK